MIQLSKSGNAIKFTFDENSGYLQNGTIDVPVNSLSLILDESNMATFRKSASNDIFVSALVSDFGMSKSELEAWYKENMVGSTGGGGGGDITSGEVQTMIDESISGKADTSAVTASISAATDDMATQTWVGEQGYITGVDLSDYATLQDIPDVSDYFDGAEYDSGTTRINFYHGNTVKAYIDASAFIVDGMIDDVRIETISGASYLVIDFNTASGKEDIQIPLTDIFDPSNYYDKDAIDGIVSGLTSRVGEDEEVTARALNDLDTRKLDASAYTPTDLSEYWTSAQTQSAITSATNDMATQTWVGQQGYITGVDLSDYATTEYVDGSVSGKADTSAVTEEISAAVSGKVDTSAVTTSVTSASTDSEIPTAKAVFDAIPTGGSASYSAGTGINIDSANTISAVYRGYLKPTSPQSSVYEYSGEIYVIVPWYDCVGQESGQCNVYTVEETDEYRYSFALNPSTKQYTLVDYPIGAENDWQNYITIQWDDSINVFKITTLQEVYAISDAGCVRLFRVGNYGDYTFKFSGSTTNALDGICDEFNNYVRSVSLGLTSTQMFVGDSRNYGSNYSYVNLGDLTGDNSTLNTNIKVGLGVSAWTEVEMTSCNINGEVKTPIFRMSGDTSDLSNFNNYYFDTQWLITIGPYGMNTEVINWDANENKFVLNSAWFGESGTYGTATVTYDSSANTLTIAYPLTVTIDGSIYKVSVSQFYNYNCKFGEDITKFEYYSELEQPIRPYVQETRAAVNGKVDTSAVTTSVTSASTDSEIPTAKAVYDAIPTGGSASYSAGTNISIADDTISCTLPISVGNSNTLISIGNGSNKNIAFGQDNTFGGTNANCLVGGKLCKIGWNVGQAVALGYASSANSNYSTAIGVYVEALNNGEVALGKYNVSNTGSTKTIFSVGNGTADNARHNAFEIRQNGDIYITSGGTDIKLQDNLGGGSVTTTSAVTSGSTDCVTSGGVYEQLGGLKLQQITQAAYDALVSGGTVDSSTLYIITNVVN